MKNEKSMRTFKHKLESLKLSNDFQYNIKLVRFVYRDLTYSYLIS